MVDCVKNDKKINYQFKILYAIGMFLVVANHCGDGAFSLFYEFFPAYAFHMGLFVFCSGYFYKESAENGIGRYILKKIKSLILPMYLWNFVYALIAQILTLRGFSFGAGVTINQLLLMPLYNGHQYVYNLPTWFIFPLFTVEVFNVFFRKLLSPIKGHVKEIVYVCVAIILGMLGIYLSVNGLNNGWGLIITRMLCFIPFYCVGYFYKTTLEEKDNFPNVLYFGIVIFAELAIIIYKGGTLSWEQSWSRYAEFNAWPFVVGFLGIAFWLRIARILEPVVGKSRSINLIADNTFSIMVNQFLGFMLVKSIFAFCYKHSNSLFSDFNWNEYHTNIWYYYLPKGLFQTRIIYIVVSIVLAIFIQKTVDYVKMKIFDSKKEKLISSKKIMIKKIIAVCTIIVITTIPATLISRYVNATGGIKIPQVNTYSLGTKLYFDKEKANVGKYIDGGFSSYEDTFTWTDGIEAAMSFSLLDWSNNTDLKLNFTCGIYGLNQNISIYVNDNLIDSLNITEKGTYTIIIPKEAVESDSLNIKFEIPGASSPASNDESADARLLGLCMESMEISSVY